MQWHAIGFKNVNSFNKKITSFLIQNRGEQILQKEHVRFIMTFNSLWALQGSIHWNLYSHI